MSLSRFSMDVLITKALVYKDNRHVDQHRFSMKDCGYITDSLRRMTIGADSGLYTRSFDIKVLGPHFVIGQFAS